MLKYYIGLLCVTGALSACGPSSPDQANATHPTATTTSQYDQEIDHAVQQMQAQLPIKIGDVMEISSIARADQTINYSFTVFSEAITPAALGLDKNRQTAMKQLCAQADTKRFLAAGYQMNFHYLFRNQEKVTLSLSQKDC